MKRNHCKLKIVMIKFELKYQHVGISLNQDHELQSSAKSLR